MKASRPYENRKQPLVSPVTHILSVTSRALYCLFWQPFQYLSMALKALILAVQVPALAGKGAPDPETMSADISLADLPHDEQGNLLRPGVVWWEFHYRNHPNAYCSHMSCGI